MPSSEAQESVVVADCGIPFTAPSRDEPHRRFSVVVHREAADGRELELIHRAEELPPAREIPEDARQIFVDPDPRPWSWQSFDGVRVVDVVSGDAVAYYVDLLDELRRNRHTGTGVRLRHAALRYEAQVAHQDEYRLETGELFTDVDVVTLDLDWYQYCGHLCALGVHAHRIVVFDRDGTVQAVLGDRESTTWVS